MRTWAFSFNLAAPDVHFEEVGAILRAKKQSQGGHYSDRAQNCRYDWLTLNHFADMTGTNAGALVGVTLANADCYFARLGNSTAGTLDTATPQLAVLAGGQVDGAGLGILNQGGDTHFLQRFALRTHDAYDAVAAMKFALEFQNPLVTATVTGGSAYPATAYSHLTISNPNVLLWALKPHEEGMGQGVVARVWNLAAAPSLFQLTVANGPLTNAQRLTHIETPLETLALSGGALTNTMAGLKMETFGLKASPLPKLSHQRQGANLLLSWPTNFAGFVPEYATNLPAANWLAHPVAPVVLNGWLAITSTMSAPLEVCRLKHP